MTDLISRADAIDAVLAESRKVYTSEYANAEKIIYEADAVEALAMLPSAEPKVFTDDEWIPCSERLPKDLDPVNATWVNHNPPCYYMDIMNVPFTGTCVRYKGKWYWWDSTICDVLGEYGEQYGADPIDKYIEVIAWMPLPEPYREDGEA